MSTLAYIKNFIKDRNVASITPTSPLGVRRVCGKIDFDASKVFVEYGPGTGVIADYVLARMASDAQLLLIERNKNFVSILKRRYQDPRVNVLHASAEDVLELLEAEGVDAVDYIISGIPFSYLSETLRGHIVQQTYHGLRAGGRFLAYQTFWQADAHLRNHLDRHFEHVKDGFELFNAPPMRIYEAHKNGAPAHRGNGVSNGHGKERLFE